MFKLLSQVILLTLFGYLTYSAFAGQFLEGVETAFKYPFVTIPWAIMNYFGDWQATLSAVNVDGLNNLESFAHLVKFVVLTGLTLALPALWVLTLIFWIYGTLLSTFPRLLWGPGASSEAHNMMHLVTGRTTIQKTFDAEVQANAVASALDKKR